MSSNKTYNQFKYFWQTDAADAIYQPVTFGYCLYVAADMFILFAPVLVLLDYFSLTESLIISTISLLARLMTYFISGYMSHLILTKRRMLYYVIPVGFVLVIILALCGQLGLVNNSWLPLFVMGWFCLGISQSLLLVLWNIFFSIIPTRKTPMAIAFGATLGTVLFFIIATSEIVWVVLGCITAIMFGSMLISIYLHQKDTTYSSNLTDGFENTPSISKRAIFSVIIHGIIYGYVVVYLCNLGKLAAIIGASSGIVACIATMVLIANMHKTEFSGVSLTQRISLPIVTLSLLCLPWFGPTVALICCCLIVIAMAGTSIIDTISINTENSEFNQNPIKRGAFHQFPSWIGFSLGICLAIFTVVLPDNFDNHQFIVIIGLTSLAVLAYAIYSGNDTEIKDMLNSMINQIAPENNTHQSGGKTQANGSDWQFPRFDERCKSVAADYSLTPREIEIFQLLGRGRNSVYIQRNLYISSSTVKTHIYHIYRKMGINTHQQLMDLVDAAKLHDG